MHTIIEEQGALQKGRVTANTHTSVSNAKMQSQTQHSSATITLDQSLRQLQQNTTPLQTNSNSFHVKTQQHPGEGKMVSDNGEHDTMQSHLCSLQQGHASPTSISCSQQMDQKPAETIPSSEHDINLVPQYLSQVTQKTQNCSQQMRDIDLTKNSIQLEIPHQIPQTHQHFTTIPGLSPRHSFKIY